MTSMECSSTECKTTARKTVESSTPQQMLQFIEQLQSQTVERTLKAAQDGNSFDEGERQIWASVKEMGFQLVELFICCQGTGDLGKEVTTEDERTLKQNAEPSNTTIRSIFGTHHFKQCAYSTGEKKKIELRPISARMQLPENGWSYLLQEFSQMFCVDQAFNQAARNLETVLDSTFSVDTLEQTTFRMGGEAGEFLAKLPVPKRKSEKTILVASADCKGVPLIKEDSAPVAAFETRRKQPGNRRMATVASVYTVDRYERTPEDIVEALFRETPDELDRIKRPRPTNKHTTAHLPTQFLDGDTQVQISCIHEGISWLAAQVHRRHKKGQELVLLMDGQEALWSTAELNLSDVQSNTTQILDILHVSQYVWEAAALFKASQPDRKEFARERLLKILQGNVSGVVRGLRRMGTMSQLKGEKLKELNRICGYLEKNQHRMQYDRYLAAGYPIASGVIEGACAHLVKDRMERSGMRWTLEGARSMLNVRAAFQSDYWRRFCDQRIVNLKKKAYPHINLIKDYKPLALTC